MTYHTSRNSSAEELAQRAEWNLDRAVKSGYDSILADQQRYLNDFWQRSDLQVDMLHKEPERNIEVQQAIRFSLFHILQAGGRTEGAGIAAKGLTGQAYEGHYFWDMEIYVLPFLIYTSPQIAKNILKFRHSMLDKARLRAREVNQKGALFPWRTINGEEASAYYAAGTAQYHINADIIYALMKYVRATGDEDMLYNEGAEMLVETARLWNDLGFYSERRGGKFCIQGVTGPDEYNTVVDNNTYTNLMARENLQVAAEIGRLDKALKYARYSVLMDLGDVGDNVRDGVHIASMGAAWMVFVYGFAGMRDDGGCLTFAPNLSPRIERIRFPLKVRDQVLVVDVNHRTATYTLSSGDGLVIRHRGREIRLTAEKPRVNVPNKD